MLSKNELIEKYEILKREMKGRNLRVNTDTDLDRALFKKAMLGIDVASLGDIVQVVDYISLDGSWADDPKGADDIDVIIREEEENRDEDLELKLGRVLSKATNKKIEFLYRPKGPHATYLPAFDKILRAKSETRRVKVKERYDRVKKSELSTRYIYNREEDRIDIIKADGIEKGIRPAFGSPGGKRFLAKTIVGYIPEHKTYVEPFVGEGAVFFAKEPSEVEVINDLDSEIAFAYRFMKGLTDEQFKKLEKMDWDITEDKFNKLKNLKPSNEMERFYRLYNLSVKSYGQNKKAFNPERSESGEHLVKRLSIIKQRLKNTKILSKDYQGLREYDSLGTFFYLDPPYPDTKNVGEVSLIELHKFCRELKGKFILSLNNDSKNRKLFKDFKIKKVETHHQMATGGSLYKRTELLISNFPLKKQNIYLAKGEKLKLTLIGTGALNSPRKDESLLVQYGDENILIDAGPDIKAKEFSKLTGILVCDLKSDFMKDAKRIGEKFGLIPQVKKIERDGLKIEPFEVKHTNHKTYGYRIQVDDKKIIYAPEFFEFPKKEVEEADLAILEGSAWDRPIRFIGGAGGHAALLDTWEECKKLKVPVIFTHIGKPVEKYLKEAEEMGIKIGRDGQEIASFEKAKKLTLGKPFTPLKTAGGYGKLEFSDVDALWKFWAKGYLEDP